MHPRGRRAGSRAAVLPGLAQQRSRVFDVLENLATDRRLEMRVGRWKPTGRLRTQNLTFGEASALRAYERAKSTAYG
jgi:hypothetical protein